ncbi:hypothetical protein C8Q79DRAFT_471326 [Trametes meyenii]|nr:hypothetical protein C8Q79DRAFT_471326 [Trametes meyenii]
MDNPTNGTAALAPLVLIAPSPDNLFGGVFVSTLVALLFYGMCLHQSYRYYNLYPRDSRLLKGLVIAVLAAQTFHVVLCTHASYSYIITDFFNPLARALGSSSAKLIPVSSAVTIFLSQSFFAHRVYLLGFRYRIFAILSVAALIVELGFFIAVTIQTFPLASILDLINHRWLIPAASGSVLFANLILAGALLVSLREHRAGLTAASNIVDEAILYTLSTGLLPLFVGVAAFAMSFISRDALQYFSVTIIVAELHANALLAALNARPSSSGRGLVGASEGTLFGTALRSGAGASTTRLGHTEESRSATVIGIKVTRETTNGSLGAGTGPHHVHDGDVLSDAAHVDMIECLPCTFPVLVCSVCLRWPRPSGSLHLFGAASARCRHNRSTHAPRVWCHAY